jgi:hypothetical protein
MKGRSHASNPIMGINRDRFEAQHRIHGREVLAAALIYSAFLALAVIMTYTRGPGLLRQVIWDPVTLYSFYPGEQTNLRCFQQGYFPLWDSSRGLGVPHLLPTGGTFYYPLKLMAYGLNSDAGWELYFLLRFLLAGLFCFLSARGAGLGFRGALFAGLSYLLCGYFREYSNQESMNVELLFPLVLFMFARFARRPSVGNLLALLLTESFFICNPESGVYTAVYGYSYYAWVRTRYLPARTQRLRTALELVVIVAGLCFIGLSLMAAGTIGFFEYYFRSWIFHPPGLGSLVFPGRNSIALVTPLFDYFLGSTSNLDFKHLEQLGLVPAYLGLFTLVLAGLALTRLRRLPAAGLFFAAMALILAGMIFGLPPFSLILKLPVVRSFQNFRYAQPYLAHAVSILAGLGLELAVRDRKAARTAALIGAAAALWIAAHVFIFRRELMATELMRWGLLAALVLAAGLASAAAVLGRLLPARRAAVLAAALIIANGLELALYFNLALPVFGPKAFSIEPPPAAAFITARDHSLFRIMGLDQRILHPNLAGTSGLADLRDHTPLTVRDYALFMSAANGWTTDQERIEKFLAEGKFYFDLDWNQWPPRLLDLVNVRYVLSYKTPGARDLIDRFDQAQILAPAKNYVSSPEVTVADKSRPALLVHAPARLWAPLATGRTGTVNFETAILETARACPATDGVHLELLLERGPDKHLAFARTLQVDRDRGWRPLSLPLSSADQAVELASLPGPRDDQRCDFGVVSAPELMAPASPPLADRGLELIYDRELRVYENRSVLPRVFSVSELKRADTLAAFLSAVKREDPAQTAWIGPTGPLTPDSYGPAEISAIQEGPGRITFRGRADRTALIVISDLYFPGGWRAWVDGVVTRVNRVDGLLQAVVLPPGEHEVVMAYVPVSFHVGMWTQLTSLAVLIVLIPISRWSKLRK